MIQVLQGTRSRFGIRSSTDRPLASINRSVQMASPKEDPNENMFWRKVKLKSQLFTYCNIIIYTLYMSSHQGWCMLPHSPIFTRFQGLIYSAPRAPNRSVHQACRCSEPFPWRHLKLSLTEATAAYVVLDAHGPQIATVVGTVTRSFQRECIARDGLAFCILLYSASGCWLIYC